LRNFSPQIEIFFSFKANPNLEILKIIRKGKCGADISSLGELFLAKKSGFKGEDIVFAGPGKKEKEIEEAIKENIFSINAESLTELKRINSISEKFKKKTRVALRINPTPSSQNSALLKMGKRETQFGIPEEILFEKKFIKEISSLKHINIEGIHLFSGTQILCPKEILDNFKYAVSLAKKLSQFFPINFIDFGGGFGVPYDYLKEHTLDINILSQGLKDILRKDPFLTKKRIIFELGRFIVAESGVFVTKVVDVKTCRRKKFAVLDGGINNLLRVSFLRENHPVINFSRTSKKEKFTLVGPLCTPLDILGEDVKLSSPKIGDLIGILNAGAYGFSESMPYFLSHPICGEYLYDEKKVFVIREPLSFQKYLKFCKKRIL